MINKNVLIENITNKVINTIITEAEWAFHQSRGEEHTGEPYRSENKFVCDHETGQFGSGTYFSTYNAAYEKNDLMSKYGNSNSNQDGNFIKVADSVYRVDMNLYKNLYRVYSEKQGDILHTMMGDLNKFYRRVSDTDVHSVNFKKEPYFANSGLYQCIATNADALGLKCPSYLQLTRMAQSHSNSENIQSFATLFMEYNGFNGVNVCGVDKFDNSRHGSVIFDLSKVSSEVTPVGKVGWMNTVGYGHTHTYAAKNKSNSADELLRNKTYLESLNGKFDGVGFKQMTSQEKMRIIKNLVSNYGTLGGMNARELKYYLKGETQILNYIFNAMFNHDINDDIVIDGDMREFILKNGQIRFINYESNFLKYYNSFLIDLLDDKKWDFDNNEQLKQYLDSLLSKLNRPLTEYEKEFIDNEYFEEI